MAVCTVRMHRWESQRWGGDIPGSIVPWDIELVNNNAFLLAPFPPAKVVNRLWHLVKS